jgi:hypothetical protein
VEDRGAREIRAEHVEPRPGLGAAEDQIDVRRYEGQTFRR